MRVYIIEYRRYDEALHEWSSKISQEGFTTLREAQQFIEAKPSRPGKITEGYYQTALFEEYYIHDVLVRAATEAHVRKLRALSGT